MPKIHYEPPEDKLIEQYARLVCEKLAEKGMPSLAHPDAAPGFAAFLRILFRIRANELNGAYEEQVDNEAEARYSEENCGGR